MRGKVLLGVLAYAEWVTRLSDKKAEGAETSGPHQKGTAWVERQLARIFPRGEDARPYRQAAWDAYCVFWLPDTALFLLLEGEYRYAIDALEGYARTNP